MVNAIKRPYRSSSLSFCGLRDSILPQVTDNHYLLFPWMESVAIVLCHSDSQLPVYGIACSKSMTVYVSIKTGSRANSRAQGTEEKEGRIVSWCGGAGESNNNRERERPKWGGAALIRNKQRNRVKWHLPRDSGGKIRGYVTMRR